MSMRTSGRRNRLSLVLVAVALTLAFGMAILPGLRSASAQSGGTVTIADFAFSPNQLTVDAGTAVTWVNNDSVAHTATGDNGAFDTGQIAAGGSATLTFDTPGTYTYICSIHPNMTGTIVVQATGGGDETPQLPDTGSGPISGSTNGSSILGGMGLLAAAALACAAFGLRRRSV